MEEPRQDVAVEARHHHGDGALGPLGRTPAPNGVGNAAIMAVDDGPPAPRVDERAGGEYPNDAWVSMSILVFFLPRGDHGERGMV